MTTLWQCSTCDFSTESPREAFLHRSKDPGGRQHHVHPVSVPQPSGIDRQLKELVSQ